MKKFTPVAVPLIVNDPYFSIWAFEETLTSDATRHWTGHAQSIYGCITIDDKKYSFLGNNTTTTYSRNEKPLKQVSVVVKPTTTIYTFTHPACTLKVTFQTPLLMDHLEILSRPVSYMYYEIIPKEEGHTFSIYLDASAQIAGDFVNGREYQVILNQGDASIGTKDQKILGVNGDDVRIDWGYFHLVHENATAQMPYNGCSCFKRKTEFTDVCDVTRTYDAGDKCTPVLCTYSQKLTDTIIFAYDDIHSIEYNHKPVDAYYKKKYKTFEKMLAVATSEKEIQRIKRLCASLDKKLIVEMKKISQDYANIGALLYRQAIAAHKLVLVDNEPYFLSKENFSNGCLATLDVTYPSIPLFLLGNTELVKGMMRPLFAYARSNAWPYPYAPHDCGKYPFCNGQVYSTNPDGSLKEEKQMPIEECGNAILTLAATYAVDKDFSFVEKNKDLLQKWVEYLVEYGYDPANQLCTDDFAGHLAHNVNLSIKAIVAIGSYGKMFQEEKYTKLAKELAKKWEKDALREDGKAYRLTFTEGDSWSLKYNIIWDKLLRLDLFSKEVYEKEVAFYQEKMNPYGVPLDCRADFTKVDWELWTTVMTDNQEYLDKICNTILRFMEDTVDRVPLTDWYLTSEPYERGFQARSVVGGYFIHLLKNKLTNI